MAYISFPYGTALACDSDTRLLYDICRCSQALMCSLLLMSYRKETSLIISYSMPATFSLRKANEEQYTQISYHVAHVCIFLLIGYPQLPEPVLPYQNGTN